MIFCPRLMAQSVPKTDFTLRDSKGGRRRHEEGEAIPQKLRVVLNDIKETVETLKDSL